MNTYVWITRIVHYFFLLRRRRRLMMMLCLDDSKGYHRRIPHMRSSISSSKRTRMSCWSLCCSGHFLSYVNQIMNQIITRGLLRLILCIEEYLILAHVGDSRAALCWNSIDSNQPLSISSTQDHVCSNPTEIRAVLDRSHDRNAFRRSSSDVAKGNTAGPLRVAGSLGTVVLSISCLGCILRAKMSHRLNIGHISRFKNVDASDHSSLWRLLSKVQRGQFSSIHCTCRRSYGDCVCVCVCVSPHLTHSRGVWIEKGPLYQRRARNYHSSSQERVSWESDPRE